MRRRLLLHASVLVALLAPSPVAAKPGTSWAAAELKAVVAAGLMAKEAAARPDDPVTRGEVETIVAGIAHVAPVTPRTPAGTVTMAALDSKLVTALGLTDVAKAFTRGAKNAGLAPPTRFGTEAVARLLGLRTNHPAAQDNLELLPTETATRAEAAYSGAQILRLGGWEVDAVRAAADTFTLAKLQPADVIFFGAQGSASKPGEVEHMGIYLGDGWFIHSSRYGVAIAQLS